MITIEKMQFRYTMRRPLFEDLDLTMASGHIYGLLGKNGAGKSTLLKIMSGLLFPQEGSVTTMGMPAEERRSEMLQDLYFLQEEMFVPRLTIRQFEKAYAPFYPNFNHEQFEHYLTLFEIDKESGFINRLSHGQKKKVLISFGLATNTRILLMDEPTNGLDIPSKSIFRKIMAEAATEEQLIVISTHQVRDLHSLIDTVTILDNGNIIMNAGCDEITDKLLFDVDNERAGEENTIFSEETPRGTYQVKKNPEHIESKIDLELLFNAAIFNKDVITNIFK